MKIILLYLLSCMLVAAGGEDWYSRWDSAGKTWHEKWSNTLNTIDELPFPDRIEMLGKAVESSVGGNMGSERSDIFTRAQSTLLSIPGHAKYYQDKIEWLRAQALVDVKKSDDEIRQMRADKTMVEFHDYESFREKAFLALGLLPSWETVSVLGHFLNDPEGLDGKRLSGGPRFGSDYQGFPANAEASVLALSKLGIKNSPFQAAGNKEDYNFVRKGEIDAWKTWWSEVKDGKRTFRFIGSNVEYGPEGPVSRKKPLQSRSDRKSDAVRPPQEESLTKPLSVAGIIAAGCFCVAAVWYYLRSARMKSS